VASRYTLLVDLEGDNLRIHFANPTFELGKDLKAFPAPAEALIVAQLAGLMPDYMVTRTGGFVGVHDLPRLRTRLREIFPKDLDSNMLKQIQTFLTSEAFLNSQAEEQWNAIVGEWAGSELKFGAQYSFSTREPSPVFPEHEILMNYSFSAKRLVPCRRGGVDRSCVELEMRSTADPEDTKRMVQSVLSSLGGKEIPQTPVFQTLESENVPLVITEAEGLVPHKYKLTQVVRGTVSADGKKHRLEQIDTTEVGYAYP
jgi:hypothetical protein